MTTMETTESLDLPTTPASLLARLAELGIEVENHSHVPIFTVAESKALPLQIPGAHIKNLFLKNKKGRMWLVVCLEDRKIDLKDLGERLGAGRLSFGSPDRLMTHLGVKPGAVTPFAVINDPQGAVTLVLDAGILAHDQVNCHPLVNHMTTVIKTDDLMGFFEALAHPPQVIALD